MELTVTETENTAVEKVEEKTIPPNVAPEDMAAKEFQMAMPALKKMVNNKRALSRKDLARILIKVIEFPLEDKERQLRGLSDDVFKLSSFLINCKLVMTHALYNQSITKGEKDGKEEVGESGNSPKE